MGRPEIQAGDGTGTEKRALTRAKQETVIRWDEDEHDFGGALQPCWRPLDDAPGENLARGRFRGHLAKSVTTPEALR
jgi:hypothetical protein